MADGMIIMSPGEADTGMIFFRIVLASSRGESVPLMKLWPRGGSRPTLHISLMSMAPAQDHRETHLITRILDDKISRWSAQGADLLEEHPGAVHVIIQAYAKLEHSNQIRRTQGAR
jgi:hypothetical protein